MAVITGLVAAVRIIPRKVSHGNLLIAEDRPFHDAAIDGQA